MKLKLSESRKRGNIPQRSKKRKMNSTEKAVMGSNVELNLDRSGQEDSMSTAAYYHISMPRHTMGRVCSAQVTSVALKALWTR